MKKRYLPAEIQIVHLMTNDVLLVSKPTDYDPNEGQHDDAGWT